MLYMIGHHPATCLVMFVFVVEGLVLYLSDRRGSTCVVYHTGVGRLSTFKYIIRLLDSSHNFTLI